MNFEQPGVDVLLDPFAGLHHEADLFNHCSYAITITDAPPAAYESIEIFLSKSDSQYCYRMLQSEPDASGQAISQQLGPNLRVENLTWLTAQHLMEVVRTWPVKVAGVHCEASGAL